MLPSKSELFATYEKFLSVILRQYSKSLDKKMFAQKYRMNFPGTLIVSLSSFLFPNDLDLFYDYFSFLLSLGDFLVKKSFLSFLSKFTLFEFIFCNVNKLFPSYFVIFSLLILIYSRFCKNESLFLAPTFDDYDFPNDGISI